MKYDEFLRTIKRTQYEFSRKQSMQSLRTFWQADSGKMFGEYMQMMSEDFQEQTRQRKKRLHRIC